VPERIRGTRSLAAIFDEIAYHGESEQTQALLAKAVSRLPEDVAGFALERCCFVSIGGNFLGLTLPGRLGEDNEGQSANFWIIVLDDCQPRDEMQATIAHEIAHAWLRHDRYGEDDLTVDCEVQAAELARDWGFTGTGADVEHHRKL